MLRELVVENLVIVERASLEMGAGLSVISGETGAGKSLLLDALHVLLGGRARSGLVGPAGDQAMVTGVFDCAIAGLAQQLEEAGVASPEDGQLILRRRLHQQGRSQAWINDTPVGAATLKKVGSQLVDIRVQHEHLRLADVARQLELIDRYGGHTDLAADFTAADRLCGSLRLEQNQLEEGDAESVKERDYLSFLLAEIDDLDPLAGEFDDLRQRQELLAGAQHWRGLAAEVVQVLAEDDPAIQSQLGDLGRRLDEAPDEGLQQAAECCRQASASLQEAVLACVDVGDRLQADPQELQRVEDRLAAYHALLRKHGGTEASLMAAREQYRERVDLLQDLDRRRQELAEQLEAAEASRQRHGQALALARKKTFKNLAKRVHAELAELGMPKARLHLQEDATDAGSLGTKRQELYIATNPGLPAGPLAEVASGGESARMTLALAVVLAEQDDTPVLVFDEVDSGVGGRLGAVMGEKLAVLGKNRSVIAVTHTPQLASAADQHFMVRKVQGDSSTEVVVEQLLGDRRLVELADMLGGGKAARQQAKSLLAQT